MADEQGGGRPKEPGAQRPARRRPARTLIGMAPATGERSVLDLPQRARAGAPPATNDDEARATLVDDAGASSVELEGPPTQIGAAPDELEGAPTQAAIVAPEAEPLEGPPAQLGARSTIEADPLPYELTMPAVEVPELEGAPRAGAPGELVVEPTAVVDPSAKSARQTYRVDVRSGLVELEPEAEDAPAPAPRRRLGVLVAGISVGLLLVAAGVVGLVVFVAGDDELAPASRGPAASSEATPSEERASAPEPPAEPAPATDDASDLAQPEPDEGAEDAAPAVGRVIPRAELEAFRLELPHLSRRTRRMSEAERRRQAVRLRALALRHYAEGRYADAESAFREALEHVPRDPASFQGMARATAQEGRLPEALAWAKAAVEQSPRSGTAYRVLGDVWRQAGYPDEARAAYRRGLFRDPRDRWLRRRLAEVASD